MYLRYFVFSSLPLLPVLAWFARILMRTTCARWGFDCKSFELKTNGPDAVDLPHQAFLFYWSNTSINWGTVMGGFCPSITSHFFPPPSDSRKAINKSDYYQKRVILRKGKFRSSGIICPSEPEKSIEIIKYKEVRLCQKNLLFMQFCSSFCWPWQVALVRSQPLNPRLPRHLLPPSLPCRPQRSHLRRPRSAQLSMLVHC